MYQYIITDEIQSENHNDMHDRFDESVSDKIGPLVSPVYFENFGIKKTTWSDLYYDNTNNYDIP